MFYYIAMSRKCKNNAAGYIYENRVGRWSWGRTKIFVVPDKNIEDDTLLGFDIASRFRVTLDEKAFTFKKVPARPDNRHNQLYNFVENKNNLGVFEQFTITSQLNFQTSVLYKCGS